MSLEQVMEHSWKSNARYLGGLFGSLVGLNQKRLFFQFLAGRRLKIPFQINMHLTNIFYFFTKLCIRVNLLK